MQQLTRIKICGLTSESDVASVNRWLPDYAGFVFAPGRRRISSPQAKMLCEILDERINRVGVFVNENPDTIIRFADEVGLNVIQLHGGETPDDVETIRMRSIAAGCRVEIWKALRIQADEDLKRMSCYGADAFLLDSYKEGVYGGTGRTFDWERAAGAGRHVKVILAGGLDSSNVAEAIRMVMPYAVDSSSGVETAGIKDDAKIRDFITAVRR